MFRRISCPLSTDNNVPTLYALRNAARDLGTEFELEVRWVEENSEYDEGLAIFMSTEHSRTEFLVAEAVVMTVSESVWWFSSDPEFLRAATDIKEALDRAEEANDG